MSDFMLRRHSYATELLLPLSAMLPCRYLRCRHAGCHCHATIFRQAAAGYCWLYIILCRHDVINTHIYARHTPFFIMPNALSWGGVTADRTSLRHGYDSYMRHY